MNSFGFVNRIGSIDKKLIHTL